MTEIDEITIREYIKGDEDQINHLHNQEVGTQRNREQWEWEFRNSPFGKSIFVVSDYKGKIVGTQALLPEIIFWNGQEIFTAKSEETLVHREFRGKGLSKKLWGKCWELARLKGITLVWGFGRQVGASVSSGFQVVGGLRLAMLILNARNAYEINKGLIPNKWGNNSFSQSGLRLLARIFTLGGFIWFRIRYIKLSIIDGFRIEELNQMDERLDSFWKTFSQEIRSYTIARTNKYFEWRIFRNPYGINKLLAAVKDDVIHGYIIISINEKNKVGNIVDLCILDRNNDQIAKMLIAYAFNIFKTQKVACINAWYVDSKDPYNKKYKSWLRRVGFLTLPPLDSFMVKLLSKDQELINSSVDLDKWFITLLFSEGTV